MISYRNLRLFRIVISVLIACAVFTAVAFGYDIWLNRWQIIPAVLAGAFFWLLLWLILTAVFGRVYCSSACPMGTMMDLFGHFGRGRRGYFYSLPHVRFRRSLTAITIVAAVFGIPILLNLLDPAAGFSRMAAWSLGPIVRPVAFSFAAALTAFVTFAFVAAVSAARGRLLCNTLCPVGTVLAEISRFSIYHIDINTDKCVGCGLCTQKCKSECIDPSAHTVDSARCVVCFDCTAACPNEAITYRRGRHQLAMPLMQSIGPTSRASAELNGPDNMNETRSESSEMQKFDRRKFLGTLLAAAPALTFARAAFDPDLEPLNPVHPPGLGSLDALRMRCTACGACSAACPSGIIRPDNSIRSLRSPLRPVLEFDTGACRYDCVRCTEVCPTGCLTPLTVSEKHIFVIGKARVVARFCREYTEGTGCGECARRCPRKAITILPVEIPEASPGHPADHPSLTADGRRRRLPHVDENLCIGCGECRYVCPSRPRAFIIEGEN